MFSYTADKEIRTDDLCLDVSRLNGPVLMLKCHHMRGNQMFEYDAEVSCRSQIKPNNSQPSSRCLQAAAATLKMTANSLLCICSPSRVGNFISDAEWMVAVCLLAPQDGAG